MNHTCPIRPSSLVLTVGVGRRFALGALLTAGIAACAASPELAPAADSMAVSVALPTSTPQVAGVVLGQRWLRHGPGSYPDSTRLILVAADPARPQRGLWRPGRDTVYFGLTPRTRVLTRAGAAVQSEAVSVGSHVAVWSGGEFNLTGPPEGHADTVVVDTR